MRRFLDRMSAVFSAGAFGGVVASLVVWYFGEKGVTAALGVKIAPNLSAHWLYPWIVWGGLWGMLFLLPLMRRSVFLRGLLLSIGPALAYLFYIFPFVMGKGVWGFRLGLLTPFFVVFFSAVWGLSSAVWLRGIQE